LISSLFVAFFKTWIMGGIAGKIFSVEPCCCRGSRVFERLYRWEPGTIF
jgi:hypothetical protein